jgi:hypothetical protein
MMASNQGRGGILPLADVAAREEKLPYKVELWDAQRHRIERVLGRAASASLARAIFTAAQAEHPDRYITLRRGSKLVTASA